MEALRLITDVPGVSAGHWTDERARTGCTVLLFPEGTRASGEVRGGAPATREWDMLDPQRLVDRIDAVVFSGGSAFGLAACDGAVRFCEEGGRGFRTPAGPVPIVVGAAIYDLDVGDAHVRPGAAEGYAACAAAARGEPLVTGRVGAGCGATVGGWTGERRDSGLGVASLHAGELVVAAVAVVNAWGDLYDPASEARAPLAPAALPIESTSLVVVVTNARLSKGECFLTAQSGHAGMARALEPSHSLFDGDAVLAAATGAVEGVFVEHVRVLAARAVEDAIRDAVG